MGLNLNGLDLKITKEDFEAPLIPEGETEAVIKDIKQSETRNGTQFLQVRMQVVRPGTNKAQTHFESLWLSEKAMKVTRRWLGEAYYAAFQDIDLDPEKLLGKIIPVNVKIEVDKTGKYSDKNRVTPRLSKEQAQTMKHLLQGGLPKVEKAPEPATLSEHGF